MAVIQAITDATEPNVANTIANYTRAIIQNYQTKKKQPNSKQVYGVPYINFISTKEKLESKKKACEEH